MTPLPSNDRTGPGTREGAFAPYLRAIQAHRLVFALVVIATVAAAAVWSTSAGKEYSATAEILVNPLPQSNQSFLGFDLLRESGDPTRTVQTAATLIETQEAADAAAKSLNDGRTGQQILNSVSVQPAGESDVLDVTATADTPTEASRTANAFTLAALTTRREKLHAQLKEEIERLEGEGPQTPEREKRIDTLRTLEERGDPTLTAAQRATPSDEPVGASAAIVIGLAVIAGLALATGTVVVLELTARKVRDESEATSLYPLPILARVPVLSRAERRQRTAGQWLLQPTVREPFRTVLTQLQREDAHRVVMFTSGSTADGKTTSSITMALTMALGGHSTILLDADFRKPGIAEALRVSAPMLDPNLFSDAAAVEKSLAEVPGVPNLRVLSPSSPTARSDALVEAFTDHLPELLARASELAQFVVIDTAPLGEISDALRVMPVVDDIIIIVYPGKTNRANFEIMRDLLERAGDRPTGMLVIGDRTGAISTYYGYGVEQQRRAMPMPPSPAGTDRGDDASR